MKKLLDVSINKIYIMVVILISLFMLGGYFSYAMFTVTKEKSNAISIVTGNLVYDLKVDGEEGNTLVIPTNTTIEFTVTLSNPNNRIARFNFYYLGSLPDGVTAGYVVSDGFNIPMSEVGSNLEKGGTSGSSNTYKIKVTNTNDSEITINLGVEVGLDYNDLTLPSNGHLFEEYKVNVSDIVLTSPGENGDTYDDGVDTFITGKHPNNYIWYSGKLWRAVSVNNEEKTTKLVTQWNISTIVYSSGSTNFSGSHMKDWLNNTTADGFLGNLRDYENFIVTDSVWDATLDTASLGSIERPNGTTIVTATVGLLNLYEYQESFRGTTYSNGYLNNGLYWWSLTPYSSSYVRDINYDGNAYNGGPSNTSGVRPSINLKSNVKIVGGDGTIDNPYRLEGDNDTNLSGTPLSSRYSGEYIKFGNEENNLYRIVSDETEGLTKITSAEPLKNSNTFITSTFGSNTTFSNTNTIGTFLNGEYLTKYVDSSYSAMIEDSTTWYLGTVGIGESYKSAKYIIGNNGSVEMLTPNHTTAKVGLLRLGELMAGQFDRYDNNKTYWTLTPYNSSYVRNVYNAGNAADGSPLGMQGVRPSINLKSNVQIVDGDGTKNNPFTLSVQ